MKKYLLFFSLALFISVVFTACEDNSTNPVGDVGSLNIQSVPTGAKVYIDNVNKGTTNTVITNIGVGDHTVKLTLSDYADTSFTVTIVKDQEILKVVTLTSSVVPPTLTQYGPVRVYEVTGTTSSQPSGLVLSTGEAKSVSDNSIDLYYHTNFNFTEHEIRSADRYTNRTRTTDFYLTGQTNLQDTLDSPLRTSSWLDHVSDTETNYFFVFDEDSHYSKVKITNAGGGTGTGDPSWVEFTWIYNETANDRRF